METSLLANAILGYVLLSHCTRNQRHDKISSMGTSSLTLTKAAKYSVSDSLPSFDLITYSKIIVILDKVCSRHLQKVIIPIIVTIITMITTTSAKCTMQLHQTTIKGLCLPQ